MNTPLLTTTLRKIAQDVATRSVGLREGKYEYRNASGELCDGSVYDVISSLGYEQTVAFFHYLDQHTPRYDRFDPERIIANKLLRESNDERIKEYCRKVIEGRLHNFDIWANAFDWYTDTREFVGAEIIQYIIPKTNWDEETEFLDAGYFAPIYHTFDDEIKYAIRKSIMHYFEGTTYYDDAADFIDAIENRSDNPLKLNFIRDCVNEERGEKIQCYNVLPSRICTVAEFVSAVLELDDNYGFRGRIHIYNDICYLDFIKGEIVEMSETFSEIMYREIDRIDSSGGFPRMNYCLTLKE